jgi:hypothetical protein
LVVAPAEAASDHGPVAQRPENPILKGVAEGGLSIVSLGFAAFTFLYGALLTLSDADMRARALKAKLRCALYATVFAVVSGAILSILAFVSIGLKISWPGDVAIALSVAVLIVLAGIAVYMAHDVYIEGKN